MKQTKRTPNGLAVGIGILALLVSAALGFYFSEIRPRQMKALSISCCCKLRNIGFCARFWATDHKLLFPTNIIDMKNEIGTPRNLICPLDKDNPMVPVKDWIKFDINKSSYEMVSPGMVDGDPTRIFMRCKFHGYGVTGDGSVIQTSAKQNAVTKSYWQ